MSFALKVLLTITDGLFIMYWLAAGASELGLISIPADMMYADYTNARVVAWNWSFFPLDIVFSIIGFMAIAASRAGNNLWRPLSLISLTLTMTAGGMAISYWIILKEFDPSWFIPNLLLFCWPMFFMGGLVRGMRSEVSSGS